MIVQSSDEKLVNATTYRDSLLVKLMVEAENLDVPAPTRELLLDYLHAYIVANALTKDNHIKIVASNKQLNIRVDELEDRVDELDENTTDRIELLGNKLKELETLSQQGF